METIAILCAYWYKDVCIERGNNRARPMHLVPSAVDTMMVCTYSSRSPLSGMPGAQRSRDRTETARTWQPMSDREIKRKVSKYLVRMK